MIRTVSLREGYKPRPFWTDALSGPNLAQILFPTGLVAGYRLNETSGNFVNAVDGTFPFSSITGSPVRGQTGKLGLCASFPSGAWAQTASKITLAGTAFTASVWVYPTTLLNNYQIAFAQWTNGLGGFALGIRNNSYACAVSGGTWIFGASAALNTWVHLVVVYNPSVSTALFANGVKTTGTPSAFSDGSTTLQLAALDGNNVYGLRGGLIDDPCLWRRALSDAEVAQLYNAGDGLLIP